MNPKQDKNKETIPRNSIMKLLKAGEKGNFMSQWKQAHFIQRNKDRNDRGQFVRNMVV